MKFREKPFIVEAVQWNGVNRVEVDTLIKDAATITTFAGQAKLLYIHEPNKKFIELVYGKWLVKRGDGTLFAMTNDDFLKRYEPIKEA